jgi:hypothetical protein
MAISAGLEPVRNEEIQMLAVTSYSEVYVQLTAAKLDEQLAAYGALAAAVKGNAKAEAALAAFAPGYFNSMLLALDHHFMHRMRGAEGKDGNPLNEVRMLSDSIMEHDGVLKENKTIKYKAEMAVAGIPVGEPIALDAERFGALATAYIAEIGKRFPG